MAEQEESGPISVHEQSRSPGKAWKAIKQKRKYKEVKVQNPKEPKQEGFTRFVCVSDTHSRTDKMCEVPPGDVLLHAGDFTSHSKDEEFEKFNKWLGTLPHPHKLVIAGNHELGLDPAMSSQLKGFRKLSGGKRNFDKKTFLSFLTNCTYLEDKQWTFVASRYMVLLGSQSIDQGHSI
ncbi:metallophosphoesterase domain-containing protein 1-like [Ptychodera flava]|uniref:metallophosphoesterase domain-containing protein 1-like n=1 Tax=Ptychodera flava TaxID=63121 RepID=UPI00396A29D7